MPRRGDTGADTGQLIVIPSTCAIHRWPQTLMDHCHTIAAYLTVIFHVFTTTAMTQAPYTVCVKSVFVLTQRDYNKLTHVLTQLKN